MEKEFDTILLTDEEGNKKELAIYLSYKSERFNKDYVIFYDVDDPEVLIAAEVDEKGNLSDVVDDDELDELDEIIAEYQSNLKN